LAIPGTQLSDLRNHRRHAEGAGYTKKAYLAAATD